LDADPPPSRSTIPRRFTRYLWIGLLAALLAAPAAADEPLTCAKLASNLDEARQIKQQAEAEGNKVRAALHQATLNIGRKMFREQCLDPYACEEFADQMNTGKLPAQYDVSFSSILRFLEDTCQ
jgi:hypothetical protein